MGIKTHNLGGDFALIVKVNRDPAEIR